MTSGNALLQHASVTDPVYKLYGIDTSVQNQTVTFTYTVTDDFDGESTGTVTVDFVNQAPAAQSPTLTVAEDDKIDFYLGNYTSDPDNDQLTYAIASQPAHGEVALMGATGNYRYMPADNYTETDLFTYTVVDGDKTSTATITVNVTPVNDAPVLTSAAATIIKNRSVLFTASAVDADNDTLNYSWDFGDGASATGSSVRHNYTRKGTYTAVVTVTDLAGAATTRQVPVTVR